MRTSNVLLQNKKISNDKQIISVDKIVKIEEGSAIESDNVKIYGVYDPAEYDFNLNIYSNIEDESLKYIINYNINALYNLISLMPNIIINNLRFNKVDIPSHWELSDIHNTDISNFINMM